MVLEFKECWKYMFWEIMGAGNGVIWDNRVLGKYGPGTIAALG